jgi:hypothetical protein
LPTAGLFESSSSIYKQLEGSQSLLREYRLLSSATETHSLMNAIQTVGRLSLDLERQHAVIRAATGPMEVWRQAGLFDLGSPFQREMEQARKLMEAHQADYRLPGALEAGHLMGIWRAQNDLQSFPHDSDPSFFENAIATIRSPWLDTKNELRSVGGFAELIGIGHAVSALPSFGEELAQTLRTNLGDWRDVATWPPAVFTDFVARSDFYLDRGLNPVLTDFPAPAFQQSLDIAGLRTGSHALVDIYGDPIPDDRDQNEEEALTRTNTAHSWLMRFEIRLRRFIDERMTAVAGSEWARHRLPNGLYDKWQEKKKAADQHGVPDLPIIHYADFTDYVHVICRKDNWREVFLPVFRREESIRESLQRLHPVRLCTMHARPITQDDELILYTEVRRLVRAME